MRLTIVIYNVRGGGSTWAAVTWANAWSRVGHDVTILAIQPNDGEGKDFPLHEDVKVRRMDLSDRPASNRFVAAWRLLRNGLRLRRAITTSRPDVVLAFDGPINVRTLMACYGMRTPIVVMEQTHPGYYDLGEFWGKWRARTYPRAAALLNLTQAASDWCQERFSLKRTAVIPNPVLPSRMKATHTPGKRNVVVAAGRLVDQKGFDMLVPAFAQVAAAYPDWDLVIHGEGPNRKDLERQVRAAGLEGRITLPGWAEDLPRSLADGDFFVLSSRYEGFGNVIVEALAAGLPVLSFDCPSGPGDIVRHGVDGLLVEAANTDALAAGLGEMMADASMRERMGARALDVLDRFSLERTLQLWDGVFSSIRK